ISDGLGANGFNLTKELTGTLVLAAANTYRGTTFINSGILTIQDAGALGDATNGTTVLDGAQLQIQGNITVANEALTLNGPGVGGTGAARNVSGDNRYTGTLILATDSAIGVDSGTLTLTGGVGEGAAASGITKVGPGTLQCGGSTSNTYTGATFVNEGT